MIILIVTSYQLLVMTDTLVGFPITTDGRSFFRDRTTREWKEEHWL